MERPQVFHADRVAQILGVPLKDGLHHTPKEFGFDLVAYYGGWTLKELDASLNVQKALQPAVGFAFYRTASEPGYYAIRTTQLSDDRTWDQQLMCPPNNDGWVSCPVVVAATAVLLVLLDTHGTFLGGKFGACAEDMQSGHKAGVCLETGTLRITSTMKVSFNGTFPTVKRIECKKVG